MIAFGDWNRAYRIFDRVGLEVLGIRTPRPGTRSLLPRQTQGRRRAGRWRGGQGSVGLTVMPQAAPRWCAMCRAPHPAGTECPVGKAQRLAAIDRQRPGPRRRVYDREWEAYRAAYLRTPSQLCRVRGARCGGRPCAARYVMAAASGTPPITALSAGPAMLPRPCGTLTRG